MGKFATAVPRSGRKAAEELLNFKKFSANMAYDLANQEHVKGIYGVKKLLDTARTGIDKAIEQGLEKAGPGLGAQFRNLNATYSDLNQSLRPLLTANEQYKRTANIKVFKDVVDGVLLPGGGISRVGARNAIQTLQDAAADSGLTAAKVLKQQQEDLLIKEAAKRFNPIRPATWKADTLGLTQLSMAAYGMFSQHPALVGAILMGQTLRSPSTTMAAATATRSMWQAKNLVSSMSQERLNQFLSNPQAINSFVTGMTAPTAQYLQTSNQLNQMIESAKQAGSPQ
jgi:hypothetical protein